MPAISPCNRFLRAVHRRVVVLRAVEAGGIAVAVSALIALALSGLLLWRGQSAGMVAVAIVSMGALTGLAWGLLRRPTMLWTAMETDRQLRLHDLLSTAWSVRDSRDPWAATVVALAEARVGRVRPRDVVLHRLGMRAWGGIALWLLMVGLVLGFYARPVETLAVEPTAGAFLNPSDLDNLAQAPRTDRTGVIARSQATETGPAARSSRQLTPAQEDESATAAPNAVTDSSPVASRTGAGGGEARDDAASAAGPRLMTPSDQGASAAGAVESSGAGRSTAAPAQAGGGSDTSIAASAAPSRAPEPWRSATWSADREAALRSVDAGQTPGVYRDLMRAYFADEAAD